MACGVADLSIARGVAAAAHRATTVDTEVPGSVNGAACAVVHGIDARQALSRPANARGLVEQARGAVGATGRAAVRWHARVAGVSVSARRGPSVSGATGSGPSAACARAA